VRQFQYDNLGRNTAEIWYNTTEDADADQNRQRTISFSFDLAGQLTGVDHAEGNRTARFIDANQNGQLDAGDTDITEYTWDHRNRLVKVQHRAGYGAAVDRVIENYYDSENRSVRRAIDADGDGHLDGRRIFVYDGNQVVMDFWRANSQDMQVGHLRQRYLWGPAVDQILAEEDVDGGTPELVKWTLTDHLNTVRDIARYDSETDTTTVVNHLVYDAYGNVTSETNSAVESLFLFTARPLDPDTGLQNNLNRWYEPSVGRWLSEDPIGFAGGHDPNLYRYASGALLMVPDATDFYNPRNRYYDARVPTFSSKNPVQSQPNLHAYCDNNPLLRIDSDGRRWRIWYPVKDYASCVEAANERKVACYQRAAIVCGVVYYWRRGLSCPPTSSRGFAETTLCLEYYRQACDNDRDSALKWCEKKYGGKK